MSAASGRVDRRERLRRQTCVLNSPGWVAVPETLFKTPRSELKKVNRRTTMFSANISPRRTRRQTLMMKAPLFESESINLERTGSRNFDVTDGNGLEEIITDTNVSCGTSSSGLCKNTPKTKHNSMPLTSQTSTSGSDGGVTDTHASNGITENGSSKRIPKKKSDIKPSVLEKTRNSSEKTANKIEKNNSSNDFVKSKFTTEPSALLNKRSKSEKAAVTDASDETVKTDASKDVKKKKTASEPSVLGKAIPSATISEISSNAILLKRKRGRPTKNKKPQKASIREERIEITSTSQKAGVAAEDIEMINSDPKEDYFTDGQSLPLATKEAVVNDTAEDVKLSATPLLLLKRVDVEKWTTRRNNENVNADILVYSSETNVEHEVDSAINESRLSNMSGYTSMDNSLNADASGRCNIL